MRWPVRTFEGKVDADGGLVVAGEHGVDVALDDARLSRANVAHDEHLEEVLLQVISSGGLTGARRRAVRWRGGAGEEEKGAAARGTTTKQKKNKRRTFSPSPFFSCLLRLSLCRPQTLRPRGRERALLCSSSRRTARVCGALQRRSAFQLPLPSSAFQLCRLTMLAHGQQRGT